MTHFVGGNVRADACSQFMAETEMAGDVTAWNHILLLKMCFDIKRNNNIGSKFLHFSLQLS